MSILDKRIPVQRRSRSRHGWRAVGTTAARLMIDNLSIIGSTANIYGNGYLKEGRNNMSQDEVNQQRDVNSGDDIANLPEIRRVWDEGGTWYYNVTEYNAPCQR